MSEGRLAPVRETDRHAALMAGLAATACSAATVAGLYGLSIRPHLGAGTDSFATSFPFFIGVAAGFGFVAGCVEGALAARAARRAADRFAPLPAFARKVFVYTAIANVVLSAIAAGAAFSGSDRVMAELCSFVVAIGASAAGASVFAWSHAVDWPHVPDYFFETPPPQTPRQQLPRQSKQRAVGGGVAKEEDVVDIASGLDDVVKEGRGRKSKSSSNKNDDLWEELEELIKGR